MPRPNQVLPSTTVDGESRMRILDANNRRAIVVVISLTCIGIHSGSIDPKPGSCAEQESQRTSRSASNDDNDVSKTLNLYLATARFPDSQEIGPELFTSDVDMHWSNGQNYQGREAVLEALQASQDELSEYFQAFEATAKDIRITSRGDVAWVFCRLTLSGTMKDGQTDFSRSTRSSFIFVKDEDRWRVAYEHSEALAD